MTAEGKQSKGYHNGSRFVQAHVIGDDGCCWNERAGGTLLVLVRREADLYDV
jgi:hypothetical protein